MEFAYDGTPEQLREMLQHHKRGEKIVCAKCHTPLIVALDLESAKKHRVHMGVYCPRDNKHVMLIAD